MYRARHWLTAQGKGGVPCDFLHLPANPAVALVIPEDRPPLPYLPQEEITLVAAGVLATEIEVLSAQKEFRPAPRLRPQRARSRSRSRIWTCCWT